MFVIPMLLRPGRESQQHRNYKQRSFTFGCLNTKWPFVLGQSLVTKLVVALGYKLTHYLFIGGEF